MHGSTNGNRDDQYLSSTRRPRRPAQYSTTHLSSRKLSDITVFHRRSSRSKAQAARESHRDPLLFHSFSRNNSVGHHNAPLKTYAMRSVLCCNLHRRRCRLYWTTFRTHDPCSGGDHVSSYGADDAFLVVFNALGVLEYYARRILAGPFMVILIVQCKAEDNWQWHRNLNLRDLCFS